LGKKKISQNLFQEISVKREIFVNFLPQKIMTKYGIVSTYSVTFLSQRILECLQCFVYTLDIEPTTKPSLHWGDQIQALKGERVASC